MYLIKKSFKLTNDTSSYYTLKLILKEDSLALLIKLGLSKSFKERITTTCKLIAQISLATSFNNNLVGIALLVKQRNKMTLPGSRRINF